MILILGDGMLGSMLQNTWLEGDALGTNRTIFDAEEPDYTLLGDTEWVINCIGVIKPYCDDVERAIVVNSLFPYELPEHTLQITTDCVFSGKDGSYTEESPHDATDVYGKTKSLGEAPHVKNLRCSIIGPEPKHKISLLEWLLKQEGEVNGFTNHLWNGITTYHFSKICQGIIREGIQLPSLQHIVPADIVTKAELLRIIAEVYKKNVVVKDVEAPVAVDRTLSTLNPKLNLKLWQAAGYDEPPTIRQMIKELAAL